MSLNTVGVFPVDIPPSWSLLSGDYCHWHL